MADNALEELRKALEEINKLKDAASKNGVKIDTSSAESAVKNLAGGMTNVTTKAKEMGDSTAAASGVIAKAFYDIDPVLGRVASSILKVGEGASSMKSQFSSLFSGTGIDEFAAGFDELTEMTRNLRESAIDVGSSFGLGFEQIRGSYQSYISSILLAQNNTYESRQQVQEYTNQLAQLGVTLDEVSRVFQVSGTQQNLVSEGMLLAADTGLNTSTVLDKMATAMRKMGVSAEDAGRPLVALENIAKETGLPIAELSNTIFRTAQEGARLGLTIDGMAPIVRRFVDTLGPGFKGLAIDETRKVIQGLENQINSANAAFMAMEGGLSRPGAGVAEAQLAFEDAFKNPIEVVKSLQATLAGVTGGRVIKFEEARANPELANQFKIQRDLLAQLTGNTDPQSQRTLMNILADLQSGRQLSAEQNRTLEDSLKSGTQKQEERATMQDRVGKATVGLLTQISLNTSAMFDRLLPPQTQSGLARIATEKGMGLEQKGIELFNNAMTAGSKLLESVPGIKEAKAGIGGVYEGVMTTGANTAASLRAPLAYSVPSLPGAPAPIPPQATLTPFTGQPHASQPGAPTASQVEKKTEGPGERGTTHVIVTLKPTDELTRVLSEGAVISYNKTLHGNG